MLDEATGGALEPLESVIDGPDRAAAMSPSRLMQGLGSLYRAVLTGVAYIPGAQQSVSLEPGTPQERDRAIDAVIRHHALLAAVVGFVTNLGGLITLPVALPANLVGVTAIQMNMFQAIARIYRLDPADPAVMAFALASLVGGNAVMIVDGALAKLAEKAATKFLSDIPAAAITAINRSVGFRLVTKFGTTGTINLVRWVPIAGGMVCGSVDGGATYGVGRTAKKLFARSTDP